MANWISKSTFVRASYFVEDRIATHDELGHTIREQANIFACQLAWGFLWQEKPDDCVALYRELMANPVFSYLHLSLWFRPLERPRVSAWNDSDRLRENTVWQNFVQDLETSTNFGRWKRKR
ncbi:MAG TPA: hypothetical protein VFW05_07425 [Verrucomicrobiae bacterium]|nr:hypothetical protein [Verrucomicrobiae bacterium]